jgi:hypothetical protein
MMMTIITIIMNRLHHIMVHIMIHIMILTTVHIMTLTTVLNTDLIMIRIPVTELSQSLNQIQNLFQVILALVPNQSQDMDQGLFQVRELDQSLVLTAGLDTTDTDYQSFVNCNYYNEKGLHTLDL